MEKEDMMLLLLIVMIGIAALQAVQISGMYGEANQMKTTLQQLQAGSSAIGSGIGSGAMAPQLGSTQQSISGASQGLGGC